MDFQSWREHQNLESTTYGFERIPLTEARKTFSDVCAYITHTDRPLILTARGIPKAGLISIKAFENAEKLKFILDKIGLDTSQTHPDMGVLMEEIREKSGKWLEENLEQ